MQRTGLAFLVMLALCCPSPASDEQDVEDCRYWRLAENDTEKSRRLALCDRIVTDKHFSPADRAQSYASRASHASSDNRPVDAIADLDQALALSPDSPGSKQWRHDRAFLLYFKQDYDRAIQDFDKLLAADPKQGQVVFFRGLAYLAKNDETRGFADLDRGVALLPDDHWYIHRRAMQHAKRGRMDAALADVDKAIALKGDEHDPYMLRADLYAQKGDTGKAIADLTRAVEIDPTSLGAYSNRALMYERAGERDRAVADYDTLLRLHPDLEYYKTRKAALLEKGPAPLPAAVAPPAAPAAPAAPPAAPQPPAAKAEAPAPVVPKKPAPEPDKELDCRYYDALSNRTIAVRCPD